MEELEKKADIRETTEVKDLGESWMHAQKKIKWKLPGSNFTLEKILDINI